MDFSPCLADCNVWFRPAVKTDGTPYYEYLLVYTDDLLVLSQNPKDILNAMDQHYLLKEGSIGSPTQYLGAQVGEYRLSDDPGKKRWFMSSEKYVKEAIRNVRLWLEERNGVLKSTKTTCVLPSGYRPEVDVSEYCDSERANYYQQQIGVLRWAVELGRIDIACEVSMLAAFSAAPRVGHFNSMLHVFSYLRQHDRSKLVFDDSYIDVDDELDVDWHQFYPDASEETPATMPEPRGHPVQMTVFVVCCCI